MQKILIIFNPHAGSGRAQKYLPLIKDYLQQQNIDFDVLATERSGHAQSLVQSADLANYQAVIAAGGDGTLFEIINGLMSHQADKRIPFGVIPVGTGNAFSRELGLMPTDWQKGIDIIAKKHIKTIDIGQAKTDTQSFYFLNIIGMGFVVNAGRTTLKIKKLGKSAYTFATLWETAKLKKHPIQLTMTLADGTTNDIDDDLVFVEVANSRYTGTSFLIAPDARIDDGLLDVIILKKISRPKILTLFPTIYSGKHVNYKEVETHKVKSITIKTPQPMPLMPDGEFIGETPVTIACLPSALKLFF
ncbi:MAG: diacylglycerol kinase family lipid kinase [Xanthomonadales bacterium]|nr:diacylglycerol kinase family lipid kinase [Xanthomonadales bacterium]